VTGCDSKKSQKLKLDKFFMGKPSQNSEVPETACIPCTTQTLYTRYSRRRTA